MLLLLLLLMLLLLLLLLLLLQRNSHFLLIESAGVQRLQMHALILGALHWYRSSPTLSSSKNDAAISFKLEACDSNQTHECCKTDNTHFKI